jgi:hypothetical protein
MTKDKAMGIREEFEKALEDRHDVTEGTTLGVALWGAKWMTERCAVRAEEYDSGSRVSDELRQFAKELS